MLGVVPGALGLQGHVGLADGLLTLGGLAQELLQIADALLLALAVGALGGAVLSSTALGRVSQAMGSGDQEGCEEVMGPDEYRGWGRRRERERGRGNKETGGSLPREHRGGALR